MRRIVVTRHGNRWRAACDGVVAWARSERRAVKALLAALAWLEAMAL